jgi:hypothetical protein
MKSFRLVVRRPRNGLSAASEDGIIARTTAPELASAVLRAAEDLAVHLPPDDPAASDHEAALEAFRPLAQGHERGAGH